MKQTNHSLHKKSIIKKTVQVAGSTFASRILGIIRELLTARYLGVGIISDAFFTAYKIPNSLRKVFAEGALSAAFIPSLVQSIEKNNRSSINAIMSLAFIIFEGILLIICGLAIWKADIILSLIAPGFLPEEVALAAPFLRVLMPFIFFLSSSALLSGALQSVGHFFIPAFSPALLNIVFISGLLICLTFSLPVLYLCGVIILGGVLQFILHLVAYWKLGFSFGTITKKAITEFKPILVKFFPCALSMSITEVFLFIDTSFASYLKNGSITLIYYANRFMNIPLGIFAAAFSTILLPHFSRVATYAPKRLSFYLFESAKLVFWITIPATLVMSFFAEKIFYTLFLSTKFTLPQVIEAGSILIAFLTGLFFFSLNKILLNIYYALHETWIPAFIAMGAALTNIGLNLLLMHFFQATGLALATSLTGALEALLLLAVLHYRFNINLYPLQFLTFAKQCLIQLTTFLIPAYGVFSGITYCIQTYTPRLEPFLLLKVGLWLWVGPLTLFMLYCLFKTCRFFNIHLYFLE